MLFQAKVRHPLSPAAPSLADDVDEAMWSLFKAIGDMWLLKEDPEPYRLRFRTFMENRIAFDPMYVGYYASAAGLIAALTAQKDATAAYLLIYFDQNDNGLTFDPNILDLVQTKVSNEFIAMRLALGSFRAWGARNYRTYIGGANIPGEPAPYRTAKDLK